MAPPRNRRPGFSRRAQYGLFLGYVAAIAGVLGGAALLLLSTFNPPAYDALRGGVAELTTPVSSGLDWARRGIASVPAGIGDHFRVVERNRELQTKLDRNRHLVMRARTLTRENRRLRRLLELRDRPATAVVAARLVNSSASSTRRYATLNAGRRQGVRSGQPVRGPDGLIGQVIAASPNTARVLLIVDTESIVPVRRLRDSLPAIAVGRGDGLLDVRSASLSNVPFKRGDTFVTSGTGGVFPPNIPVARVLAESEDSALARVFAHPDALDFALVQQTFLAPEAMTRPQADEGVAAEPDGAAAGSDE